MNIFSTNREKAIESFKEFHQIENDDACIDIEDAFICPHMDYFVHEAILENDEFDRVPFIKMEELFLS